MTLSSAINIFNGLSLAISPSDDWLEVEGLMVDDGDDDDDDNDEGCEGEDEESEG